MTASLADTSRRLDLTYLMADPPGLLSWNGLGHILSCLWIMMAALAVSGPAAHGLAAFFINGRAWLRWPARVLAQGLAFLPLTALALAAAGGMAGARGWPVPSLMPLENEPGLASWLWYWTPAVTLLCLPLTAQIFAGLLAANASPRRVLMGAACLAAAGVVMLSETLEILPGMAAPARALRQAHPAVLRHAVAHLALLAGLGTALAALWPAPARKHLISAADLIREGAVVIGCAPWRLWWRHRLPVLARPAMALVLDALAWCAALAGAWGCLVPLPLLADLHTAGEHFLEQPGALPAAALPVALCSLSLWLAARIVRHGST
ncbi:MAG TPA: hypothetical protein DIT64_19865 [Verrucomicrobiales bacterium]|nr:hypothetical protein [Verrucomicrobiales bacterium]